MQWPVNTFFWKWDKSSLQHCFNPANAGSLIVAFKVLCPLLCNSSTYLFSVFYFLAAVLLVVFSTLLFYYSRKSMLQPGYAAKRKCVSVHHIKRWSISQLCLVDNTHPTLSLQLKVLTMMMALSWVLQVKMSQCLQMLQVLACSPGVATQVKAKTLLQRWLSAWVCAHKWEREKQTLLQQAFSHIIPNNHHGLNSTDEPKLNCPLGWISYKK